MSSKYNKTIKSTYYMSKKSFQPARRAAQISREELLKKVDLDDFFDFITHLTTQDVYGDDKAPRYFAQVIGKVNMTGWENYSERDFVTYPAEYVLEAGGKIETVWGEEIAPEDASKFVAITSGFEVFAHMVENVYIARRMFGPMRIERIVSFKDGCIQTESGAVLTPITCCEIKQ